MAEQDVTYNVKNDVDIASLVAQFGVQKKTVQILFDLGLSCDEVADVLEIRDQFTERTFRSDQPNFPDGMIKVHITTYDAVSPEAIGLAYIELGRNMLALESFMEAIGAMCSMTPRWNSHSAPGTQTAMAHILLNSGLMPEFGNIEGGDIDEDELRLLLENNQHHR